MSIRISAVVCTFNRAGFLRKALRSLVDQSQPKDQYEIIVVDNGSTDDSRLVVEEFVDIENLRYVHEPVLGLSHARNTGWQNARGRYVAYLDDDAVASPQWLERILHAFETVAPKPGCVGGKVEPIWESSRPPWLSDKILPYLTILDWSKTPIVLNDERWLAGANIAIPRFLLEAVGGFEVGLGRKADRLLSNEEILLRHQLRRMGYHCYYDPEITVWHHIPASRLTRVWFMRRFYWQGVSDALLRIHLESPSILQRLWLGTLKSGRLLWPGWQLPNLLMPTKNPHRFALNCSTLTRIGYVLALWGIASRAIGPDRPGEVR